MRAEREGERGGNFSRVRDSTKKIGKEGGVRLLSSLLSSPVYTDKSRPRMVGELPSRWRPQCSNLPSSTPVKREGGIVLALGANLAQYLF